MTIEFREPKRENAPVLVGLAGGTGSGKTYSGLRFSRGLAKGQPFAVIDTENGRALHYAESFPEMRHGRLDAPFSPAAYIDAIKAADAQGFPVIFVDSASHIWEGEGGVLDMQLAEVKRLGSGDNVKMLTWVKPKTEHKAFVRQLLRTKAHIVLAMRAEDKIEIVDDPDRPGKKKVVPKQTLKGAGLDGWIPVCEKRLPFEMTLSFLLTSEHPGIPKPIKLQEQHKAFFPLDRPITEETGQALAAWAAGGAAADAVPDGAAPLASPRDTTSGGPPLTAAQAKKLNVLVGQLRDKGHITTAQLWRSTHREPVVSEDGELHWSPLRDSLSRAEASDLIDRLDKYQANVAAQIERAQAAVA